MEFSSPDTLDDACRLIALPDARAIAGGQSLMAMMNLDLVQPARLVSLRRIPGLDRIETRPDGTTRIGAMVTHATLAALTSASPGVALLAQAARVVAYPAVRNQGTIGGAVALADPAADYPAVLVAADATIELGSTAGTRRVAARDFFRGLFETAARPGELVTAIEIPAEPAGAGAHYEKLALVAGDFAVAAVAAIVSGKHVQVAIGACAPRPIRDAAVEQALVSAGLTNDAVTVAGRALAAACDPASDQRASAAYRRRVVPELVRRAIVAARGTAR